MKAERNRSEYPVRYIYVPDSTSGHCCFGYTVVDTTLPEFTPVWFNRDGWPSFEAVCETFDEEPAILICDLLNRNQKTIEVEKEYK